LIIKQLDNLSHIDQRQRRQNVCSSRNEDRF
jgi:hypothetical protein